MRTTHVLAALVLGLMVGCAHPHAPARADAGAAIAATDFDALSAATWNGTLTYLDYSSGRSTTIRSTLRVERVGEGAWRFAVGYNDEPHADGADEWRLEDAGRALRSGDSVERVVSRHEAAGRVEITTEQHGEDDGKPATIRRVRVIAARECSLAKFVRFDGSQEFFRRHEYRWARP